MKPKEKGGCNSCESEPSLLSLPKVHNITILHILIKGCVIKGCVLYLGAVTNLPHGPVGVAYLELESAT